MARDLKSTGEQQAVSSDVFGEIKRDWKKPYRWGGGHKGIVQTGFDCSGGVRKWVYNVTGEDIGGVTARALASGSVARAHHHVEVNGGSAVLKTGQAGYWAYSGGSGRGQSGNHCGFWFVQNGELHVIHAKGRAYGVVMIRGEQAERFIDKYVVGKRGGSVFSLGTISNRAFGAARADYAAGSFGNGSTTVSLTAEEFSFLCSAMQQQQQDEDMKKKEQERQARERKSI